MLLSSLDSRDFDVVLLQTPSTQLSGFVKDKLKEKCQSTADTMLTIESKADIKTIRAILGVFPPFSSRWFVHIDLQKIAIKEVMPVIKSSTTCVFFVECHKYVDFKLFKDMIDDRQDIQVASFYLRQLRRQDILYLYDLYVDKEHRMVKALFDYLVQSYGSDIDALFDLFKYMSEGHTVGTRGDIAEICGQGGLSIENLIFMLLKPPGATPRGLKRMLKDRLLAARELSEIYTWNTLYNYTKASLTTMVEIKMLLISGKIYNRVQDIPSGFDEKKIARYQRYIWKLKTVPLSHLLLILDSLKSTRWSNDLEFMEFLYKYYKRAELTQLQTETTE